MKTNQGFTLIELLVVVSIIGLMASIAFATVNDARMQARDAKRLEDLRLIRNALELYFDKYGTYPAFKDQSSCGGWGDRSSSALCGEDDHWLTDESDFYQFMPSVPSDPVNLGTYTEDGGYVYTYHKDPGDQDYDLISRLEKTNNPNRCGKVCWKVHAWQSYQGDDWCGGDEKQCVPWHDPWGTDPEDNDIYSDH